jgi:hypothetical protein
LDEVRPAPLGIQGLTEIFHHLNLVLRLALDR